MMKSPMKGLDLAGLGGSAPEEEPAKVISASAFAPRSATPSPAAKAASELTSFPSREPGRARNVQINAYVAPEAAARFKEICVTDRYSYGEFIAVLLEHYEKTKQ